jgi:hypothetical protein
MNRAICIMALFTLPALLFAQEKAAAPQADAKSFPEPDFILRDKDFGGPPELLTTLPVAELSRSC